MGLQKALLVSLVWLVSLQTCFGQANSKAGLIGEITSIGGCEYYWSSLDVLFTELLNESDSDGYVVISGNKDKVIQTIIYKEWAYNHFKFRKLDERIKSINENRFFVVKGAESTELKVQLWIIPNNAEKPFNFDRDFKYRLELKKPLILFDSGFDGSGLCPAIDYEKVYLDFLRHNSDLNGNVVFYEDSKTKFLERKKRFLKENADISQKRFRFFRSRNVYDNWKGYYEFWLVPQKKK